MDIVVRTGEWCPELDLTSGDIVTVTFADEDLASTEVVATNMTGRVRWTNDGSEPSEDHGWYMPLDGTDLREVRRPADDTASNPTVVKLWCSATAKACVQRGDR